MDRKTAYTRTFLMLKDQTIHDESIKTAYFTWWQNVRENYESRSLRLTKPGLQIMEELDLKTYTIKFPQKIIFTPQTYLWLDEFVDCPYFVDKAKIIVTMEKMASTAHAFRWRCHQIRSSTGNEQGRRPRKPIKLRLSSTVDALT